MASKQLMLPANRAFNSNGLPEAGAKAYLYVSGTTTPANFLDADGNSLGSVLTANGAGRLDTPAYQDEDTAFRLIIKDAGGVQLDDIDPFYFGFSSIEVPVGNFTDVTTYGAIGDGVTDDSSAIQAAIDAVVAAGGGTLYFPHGTYFLNTGLLLTLAADGGINVRLQGGAGTFLKTTSAIDILTISNTNVGAANTRRAIIDGLGFNANNASARGLVLTKAAYNQFTNLDFIGSGTAIVVGTAVTDTYTIGNQLSNIRITQPGNGLKLGGLYNVVTNLIVGEGISGAYAIQIDGAYCIVSGFVARGAGGAGGTATVVVAGTAIGSVLSNGTIVDSYAIGAEVAGLRECKVIGVTIVNSQTHGLRLNGCLQGRFEVSIEHASLAASGVSNHIECTNTPQDNTITAQFVGTEANLDINEASGSKNIWMCGTLPNGKTISGTNSVVIANGGSDTFPLKANNLSDLPSASTARTNLGAAASGLATASGLTTSATDKILGRSSAGGGALEEIACTAAGRALIDDADAAAQRTTLGLGTAATQPSTAFAPAAPQIQAVTSSATVTPTFSNDQVNITAQAVGLTLANPSGTAVDGWGIVIRIKDNGSSQSIAYGTQYRAVGVTLPTATAAGKVHYLGCVWNAAATKLDVLAVAQEA
jgi:hypothetical protein